MTGSFVLRSAAAEDLAAVRRSGTGRQSSHGFREGVMASPFHQEAGGCPQDRDPNHQGRDGPGSGKPFVGTLRVRIPPGCWGPVTGSESGVVAGNFHCEA